MFHSSFDTSLISGKFIDRRNDGARVLPDISDEDIRNYLEGNWNLLTRHQIAFLKEIEEDPDSIKWNREHAHYIYCDPEWFFGVLFVHFPCEQSWEENYQALRRLVGPEPLDYLNVTMAVR